MRRGTCPIVASLTNRLRDRLRLGETLKQSKAVTTSAAGCAWPASIQVPANQHYQHHWTSFFCTQGQPVKQNGPDISLLDPVLRQQWDHAANAHLGKVVIKSYSNQKVWWTCDQCPDGHLHCWLATVYHRSNGSGCPQCKGRKVCKHNSLATKAPLVAAQWDYEANDGPPDSVVAQSNQPVGWLCDVCGGRWTAPPSHRVSKIQTGCPDCYEATKVRNRTRQPTFVECRHPLLAEWDHERNATQGNFPDKVSLSSGKQMFWLCRKCPAGQEHSWPAQPKQRTGRVKTGCPHCAGKAACQCNSLQALYPDIAAEWDHARNKGQPSSHTAKSFADAFDVQQLHLTLRLPLLDKLCNANCKFFQAPQHTVGSCPKLGHDQASGSEGKAEDAQQPGGTEGLAGLPYLKPAHMDLQPPGNQHNNHWTSFSSTQWQHVQQEGPNIRLLDSMLQRQWDHAANAHLGNTLIKAHSCLKVWWTCDQCPDGHLHSWSATVDSRSNGSGCPQCRGRKVCKHNSLATKARLIAAQWDYEANDGTPDSMVAQSHQPVGWLCNVCGGKWTATPNHRVSKSKTGCPDCADKAKPKKTRQPTFAECQHPLLAEWDHERNAAQGNFPDQVSLQSNKQIFWLCNKCPAGQEHSWSAQPSHRAGRGKTGCPYCAGKAACRCNSLQALYPDIAAEWDHVRNKGQPSDHTAGTRYLAWWISRQRGSWQQTVIARTDVIKMRVARLKYSLQRQADTS
ncbi:hypothetical protein ABBQ38_008273 [Trebouxia sp. C0009 RCD-2024]